jgi:hypothetical protein
MVPVYQDKRDPLFRYEATGGIPAVGSVVSGNYNDSVTLSSESGQIYFRVYANVSIFVGVADDLIVAAYPSPAGASVDFNSNTSEINVPAVSLDLYV